MSPELRERVRAQVRDSRQRQGLPEHVQDPAVLDRLASQVLDADQLQLPWTGEDEPTATTQDPRREGRWRAC